MMFYFSQYEITCCVRVIAAGVLLVTSLCLTPFLGTGATFLLLFGKAVTFGCCFTAHFFTGFCRGPVVSFGLTAGQFSTCVLCLAALGTGVTLRLFFQELQYLVVVEWIAGKAVFRETRSHSTQHLLMIQQPKGPCTRARKNASKTSRGKKTCSHMSKKNKNSELFPLSDSEQNHNLFNAAVLQSRKTTPKHEQHILFAKLSNPFCIFNLLINY